MAPFGTPIVPNASSRWKYSTMASIVENSFYAQPRAADFSSEIGGILEEEEEQDWEHQSEELPQYLPWQMLFNEFVIVDGAFLFHK